MVLAGRNPERLAEAADAIAAAQPAADLDRLVVDLSDLDSVRSAAGRAADLGALHLLVNNAGVMASPYTRTREGFDLQMATNHWGPFLLTGLLLPQLVASGDGRVVTVSSVGHRMARHPPLHDPRSKPRPYSRWAVYGQTKLANLLFTYELDRRLRRGGAAGHGPGRAPRAGRHPPAGQRPARQRSGPLGSILDAAMRAVSQSAAAGAQPVLMAATDDLPGATYVGPVGPERVARRPDGRGQQRAVPRPGGAARPVGAQRADG